MRYLSVCSGIEAATVAWHPLGWTPAGFAEIDAFPSAVLAHHYGSNMPGEPLAANGIPNFGDFTQIEADHVGAIDLLVGGTPCQDFSIAGQRAGLDGDRGGLTLEFARLAARTRPRWLVWENVPGVFSNNEGADFGNVIGCFAGYDAPFAVPPGGWKNAGIVPPAGPDCYGLAWRVLDAQFAGVPQRRRRVFIVGYLGDWRPAAAVLLEPESLRGDPPPRRETGEVAPTVPSRRSAGGGLGTDFDCDGGVIAGTLNASGKAAGSATQQDAENGLLVAFGGNNQSGPIDVATACNAHGGPSGRLDFETETFVASVAPPVRASNPYGDQEACEDGTGRGTPIVPVSVFDPNQITSKANRSVPTPELCHTLPGTPNAPIAFDCKASGRNGFGVGDVSPTLRAMGHGRSNHNAGGQVAVAIQERAISENADNGPDGKGWRDDGTAYTLEARQVPQAVAFSIMPMNSGKDYKARETDIAQPVMAGGPVGGNQGGDYIAHPMAVRRLTPKECERLQGFPDDYTLIPYRGRPTDFCPDGPRYKALGNSMAVPVMGWIGRRIDAVSDLVNAMTSHKATEN